MTNKYSIDTSEHQYEYITARRMQQEYRCSSTSQSASQRPTNNISSPSTFTSEHMHPDPASAKRIAGHRPATSYRHTHRTSVSVIHDSQSHIRWRLTLLSFVDPVGLTVLELCCLCTITLPSRNFCRRVDVYETLTMWGNKTVKGLTGLLPPQENWCGKSFIPK